MSVKSNEEEVNYSDVVVNIPGMGPGAERAGWWLSYLQELILFGKLEVALQYLLVAKRVGALSILEKACLECLRQRVKEKMENKKENKAPTPIRTHKSGMFGRVKKEGPGVRKTEPAPQKSQPYFFRVVG